MQDSDKTTNATPPRKLINQHRRNMKAETITKDEFHVFVEEAIKENKARKGRAFFYKKPKRYEILGEKRVMRFDTKGRQWHIDGTTGERLHLKGGKRTSKPEDNLLVTDLDIKEGYKWRNIPLNDRLKFLIIGKKCLKISYLHSKGKFLIEYPKVTFDFKKALLNKKWEDWEL